MQKEQVESSIPLARKLYLKSSDFDAYAYTRPGCSRCEHDYAYGRNGNNLPHSNVCRERIMKKLSETPAGRKRIAFSEEHLVRATAEICQRDMEQATAQGGKSADAAVPRPHARRVAFEPLRASLPAPTLNRRS